MTDLTDKFVALEGQLAAQSASKIALIEEILSLMQVTGDRPTNYLAAIFEATNGTWAGVLDGNTAIHADMVVNNARLQTIITSLGALSTDVAALRSLASSIYTFMATFDWCCGSTGPETYPPALTVTEVPVDEEHCQVVQALTDILLALLSRIDILVASSIAITPQQVLSLYNADTRLDDCPKPSQAELNTIVARLVDARAIGAASFTNIITAVKDTVIDLFYTADTAYKAWSDWISYISTTFPNPIYRNVLNAVINNGLFNCVWSLTPGIDGSTFDGELCAGAAPSECVDAQSSLVDVQPANGYALRNMALFETVSRIGTLNLGPAGVVTTDPPAIHIGEFSGYTVTSLSGRVRVVCGVQSTSNMVFDLAATGDYIQLPVGITYLLCDDWIGVGQAGSGAFVARLCPGEPA